MKSVFASNMPFGQLERKTQISSLGHELESKEAPPSVIGSLGFAFYPKQQIGK